MKKEYLVTTLAQDRVGLLSRVAMVFSRRGINIERLTLAESAMKGIASISMVIHTDGRTARQIVKQIEKQVEVLQAFAAERPGINQHMEKDLQMVTY
ncbi:MAG: acetolactate synthase small subunit [Bacteroidales bacterium]|nr:acetolactate synthase small subunit [Bacteroidales bacterium]